MKKLLLILVGAIAVPAAALAMGIDLNGEAGMRSSGGNGPQPLELGVLAFGAVMYVVPTIVAAARRKVLDFPMIFLVNVALGWTVIGWAVSMAWAIGDKVRHVDTPQGGPAH